MSFYGSVYYQLVDTFYKIVARNNGCDNSNFLSELEKEMPNQAVGRKGIIELDAGNRWINFSDAGAKDSAAYKIWHGKPDTETVTPDHGFKLLNVSEEDMTDRTKDGVIQLIAADEFETYETQYDKAGHIAETIRKVYRLPKSETDERLDKLEDAVGKDIDKTQFILPEIEDENKQHLYGYVEQNTTDIQTLEKHVGTWEGVVNTGVPNAKYSITAVIGDMNELLGEGFIFDTNFKSLTQVLGTLKDLDEADLYTSEEKPTNIINGLVKLQKALKALNSTVGSNKETSDGQTNGIWSAIGEKIDNESIYDHIKAIYGDDNGNVTDSLTTLANRAQSLEDKDKSLDEDIKTINDKLGDNWSSTDTVRDAITDITDNLGTGWTSTNTVTKAVNDINTNLGTVALTMTGIEGRATNLETRAGNSEDAIKALQERAGTIEKAASQLTGRVNTHYEGQNEENSKLHEADGVLDEKISKLASAVGNVPEQKTVVGLIEETNSNFETAIGDLPEDSNVIKEIDNAETRLQTQIDSISSSLGAIPENSNAYKLINQNITDIQSINTKIGSINTEDTVSGLISKNTGLIAGIQADYLTKEAAKATYLTPEVAAEIYAPLGIIGDTSSWENPDNTIVAKINSLEGKIDSVEKIIGDEKELEEGQTIISLLLTLKDEIADIRNTINELHPTDPSTPDGEEPILPPEAGEEEEEEPVE